jgi:hypothetical protein
MLPCTESSLTRDMYPGSRQDRWNIHTKVRPALTAGPSGCCVSLCFLPVLSTGGGERHLDDEFLGPFSACGSEATLI